MTKRTTDEALDIVKKIAADINELALEKKWPIGLSVAGGIMFAAGTAGLTGCVNHEDLLTLCTSHYESAQQQRRRSAN